jgi:hypothetical protein
MKGTVLLDINNKEIFVSRHTTHHEHIFPYQPTTSPSIWKYYPDSASTSLPIPTIPDIAPSPSTTNDVLHDLPIDDTSQSCHFPHQHHDASTNSHNDTTSPISDPHLLHNIMMHPPIPPLI